MQHVDLPVNVDGVWCADVGAALVLAGRLRGDLNHVCIQPLDEIKPELKPVVSFTNMTIQVTLCKLDFEGIQVGAHIFEKKYFHVTNYYLRQLMAWRL